MSDAQSADDLNTRYDPMSRDELVAECERQRLGRLQIQHERDCAVEDVRRLGMAIRAYVATAKDHSGEAAAHWWTLQRIAQELAGNAPGCTRSHPHEEMNAECERLTEIARSGVTR